MRWQSMVQTTGATLGVLGVLAAVAVGWRELAGPGVGWEVGALAGSAVFAVFALWAIVDRNARISHMQSLRPRPTITLLPPRRDAHLLEVRNDGGTATFEAHCAFIGAENLEGKAIPEEMTLVEWANGEVWVELPREGIELLRLANHVVEEGDGETHKVTVFPGNLFWWVSARGSSRRPFTMEWGEGAPVPTVDVRVTVLTTPAVLGHPVTRRYRIDAVGNVTEMPDSGTPG